MTPPKTNLLILQGSTWILPVAWSTEEEEPNAIDLTGWEANCKFRKDNYEGRVIVHLSSAGVSPKIVFTDAENGEFELRLTASETTALLVGNHVYDLELSKDGQVIRLLQGRVTIDPEVTY